MMIFGVGFDMVAIERIARADRQFGERFARRILGPREFDRYTARRARSDVRGVTFLATRFAAKEAISKALGLGMRIPMTWRAVEILNEPSGKPVALVSGDLRRFVERNRLRLHVSVTDERAMAAAYAIAEVAPA